MNTTRSLRWSVLAVVLLWAVLALLYVALDRVRIPVRSTDFLERTIGALAVLSVAWLAARAAGAGIRAYGRRIDNRVFAASLFSSIAQGAILLVGILTVLSSLGVSIAPLLTTLGLGGLAVALALRDTLANLFSGIHIVASRQIRPGDYVKFDGGVEGEVSDIQWRTMTIRDMQNNMVVMPNEKVAGSVFTNYTLGAAGSLLAVNATLPWKGPYEALEAIGLRAAREATQEIAGERPAAKASVLLTAVNETNVQITAYLPVGHFGNRTAAAGSFLRRLYDAANRKDEN